MFELVGQTPNESCFEFPQKFNLGPLLSRVECPATFEQVRLNSQNFYSSKFSKKHEYQLVAIILRESPNLDFRYYLKIEDAWFYFEKKSVSRCNELPQYLDLTRARLSCSDCFGLIYAKSTKINLRKTKELREEPATSVSREALRIPETPK